MVLPETPINHGDKDVPVSHDLAKVINNTLPSVHASIRANMSGPVRCRVTFEACPEHPQLGEVRSTGMGQRAVSPDGTRVCLTHFVTDPTTNTSHVQLDVWDVSKRTVLRTFCFADLAKYVIVTRRMKEERLVLQAVCFLGSEDHIVIGSETGFLRVLSIPDNRVCADVRVGGSIGDVACSSRHLAVSIFPGSNSAAHDAACGIKLYPLGPLVAKGEFVAEHHILPSTLKFLPYVLHFNRDGTELFCCGSTTTKGDLNNVIELNNLIVAYRIASGTVRSLLSEHHTHQTHGVSSPAADGRYLIVGKDTVGWYGRNHQLLWSCARPRAVGIVVHDCALSEDGRDGVIYGDRGVVVVTFGKRRSRSLHKLGRPLYVHCENSSQLLAFVDRGGVYAPSALSPTTVAMARPQPALKVELERMIPHGYDIARDGTLYVADQGGQLRSYSPDLRLVQYVPSGMGVLTEVVADRFADRIALVSASGAVLTVSSADHCPRVYVSRSGRCRVLSGKRKVIYPTHAPWELMFGQARGDMWVRVDDTRSAETSCADHHGIVRIKDYDWRKHASRTLHEITMPASVRAGTELKGWIVMILEDGSLVSMDPYGARVRAEHGGHSTFQEDSSGFVRIADGFEEPRGLLPTPDNGVVVRTVESLVFLQLARDWRVLRKRVCDGKGVMNIRFDRHSKRLVACYSHCLSFWSSTDLTEMYRLYLFDGSGRQVIHAPYPKHLSNKDANHPGYFSGDIDCLCSLFNVLDADGRHVKDERQRRSFLMSYLDESMVQQATTDYAAFCNRLAMAERDLGVHPRQRYLLPRLAAGEQGVE